MSAQLQARACPHAQARSSASVPVEISHLKGAWQDSTHAVSAAWQLWLDENKRMEDHPFVVRDVEALLAGGLLRAERIFLEGPEAEELGTVASESEQGAGCQRNLLLPAAAKARTPAEGGLQTAATSLKLLFANGTCLWSVYRRRAAVNEEQPTAVDLALGAKLPDDASEVTLAEFHGRRSRDLLVDEAKYWVNHDLVVRLQASLMPRLSSALIFLDMVLCLPLAVEEEPGGGPVPFRTRMMEDMLDQACWAAESDSELLDDLSLGDDDDEDSQEHSHDARHIAASETPKGSGRGASGAGRRSGRRPTAGHGYSKSARH